MTFGYYCAMIPFCGGGKKKTKKRVCNGLFRAGNLDPSSLSPGGPVVLLVCGFRRRNNSMASDWGQHRSSHFVSSKLLNPVENCSSLRRNLA